MIELVLPLRLPTPEALNFLAMDRPVHVMKPSAGHSTEKHFVSPAAVDFVEAPRRVEVAPNQHRPPYRQFTEQHNQAMEIGMQVFSWKDVNTRDSEQSDGSPYIRSHRVRCVGSHAEICGRFTPVSR